MRGINELPVNLNDGILKSPVASFIDCIAIEKGKVAMPINLSLPPLIDCIRSGSDGTNVPPALSSCLVDPHDLLLVSVLDTVNPTLLQSAI